MQGKRIKIINKNNTTDQHFLGYFSLFVLFAVTFEIEMYSMAIIFFLVLIFIGVVYIKNDMYYINPLLSLLGYSLYQVKMAENDGFIFNVFYKGALKDGGEYLMVDKYKNFVMLKN
ncbi:MAG: hypothetical protein J6T74_05805 [Clostridia bacterium]|nr:hypothetical protein [Clostridia bacterium]